MTPNTAIIILFKHGDNWTDNEVKRLRRSDNLLQTVHLKSSYEHLIVEFFINIVEQRVHYVIQTTGYSSDGAACQAWGGTGDVFTIKIILLYSLYLLPCLI